MRGLLYRRVSNAARHWENGAPTPEAFDPPSGEKGISFFREDLLGADPAAEALAGHPDHGLVVVDVEHFIALWASESAKVPNPQTVTIYYDPNQFQCGDAHYYLVEITETQTLQSYVKEILVDVEVRAKRRFPPNGLRGGKRQL